jgi:taurine dioxygenase
MANTADKIVVSPLTDFMGALVTGIDVSDPIGEEVRRMLREAWWRYGLLLLQEQNIDEVKQAEFASIFGEVSNEGEYGAQNYVSNTIPNGIVPVGELAFHVDHSWSDDPLRGLMLYGIEVPSVGGDTRFVDVKKAFDLLSPVQRELVQSLRIVHSYPDQTKNLPIPGPDPRPGMPSSEHQMALPHPVTGDALLFCSPRHFDHIVGWPAQEGLVLAQQMAAHMERPDIIYSHKWRAGDLIIWDNLRLQHARTDFDPKYRRHLRRTQIGKPSIQTETA